MAVTDPASPSTGVGAKALSAQASDVPASAASAAINRTIGMPEILSRQPLPTSHSPLPADAELVHAFGVLRVRRLVRPYQVVALVLVGEVGAVDEQLGVLADLVGDRRIEVLLRRLVQLHAGDAAHALLHCSLRPVVVRDSRLESLVLVPQDHIPRFLRVVLE